MMEVKVYPDLIRKLLPMREERGAYAVKTGKAYRTNREIKILDTFFILKALTTTGKIKNYKTRKDELSKACKISWSTFQSRIKELETKELISIQNKSIVCTGWRKLIDLYDFDPKYEYVVKYDEDNKAQKLYFHFMDVEIEDNCRSQKEQFLKKFADNPHRDFLLQRLVATAVATEQQLINDEALLRKALGMLQRERFVNGTNRNDQIFSLNPFVGRSVATLRIDYGFKSNRSVTYTRRKIAATGIRQFAKPLPEVSEKRCHVS